MTSLRTRLTRLAACCATAAAASLVVAGPASAHVKPDPSSYATQGGRGVVRLSVPDESDTASTVGVTVTFPATVELSSARTLPVAGWTATVETERAGDTERVTRIVWHADSADDGLGPTEFGLFTFSAGSWPTGVDLVTLPVEQLYSDGSVVAWDEVAVDGASEPEHPAPTLALAPAEGTDHGAGHDEHAAEAAQGGAGHDSAAAATSTTAQTSSNLLWGTISLVSLAVSVVALGAVISLLRGARRRVEQ